MEKKDASDLLGIYFILFLTLVAASSIFMFIINWEDRFFGIKLDGWPAGLYLSSKAVAAVVLAFLIMKRESQRILWCIISIFFLGFVFILPVFSSQRNLRDELGWTIFWIELAVLVIIPVILLIGYLIVDRANQKE